MGLPFGSSINNCVWRYVMKFEEKTPQEILAGLEEEASKTANILKCAQQDITKAQTKIGFILATIHYLKSRLGDLK